MDWTKIAQAVDAARRITVAVFDADGVIFPAETVAGNGVVEKRWCYNDGQGVSLLRAIGVHVLFVTSEKDAAVEPIKYLVERWNNLPSTKTGGWRPVSLCCNVGGDAKVNATQEFLDKMGAAFEQCSYMGDDLVDAALMRKVALPVAPQQAEQAIKNISLLVTERKGGKGAVRDFANFVLGVRNINPFTLPSK